ncbi:tetratricopeptide repeat protein [Planctomyces sp. SH-PL14]|uniref:tetratricopeptide repeat protein n=1 Tax=Planctomyces sp. SH-PL14 TaxID=1632864 RepID=UPI0018D49BBC|nr:tetratricopeptide repeat protein [Planctomyces sp. SH-PL14]
MDELPRMKGAALWLALIVAVLLCQAASADYDSAMALYRSGKYQESAADVTAEIPRNPYSENLHVLLVRAEMQQGRYPEALAALDAGIGKLPQSVRLRWIGREVVRFNGQPERVARFDEEIRQFVTQFAWRYSDSPNQLDIARLMLDQGVDPKKVLSGIYGPIKKREPNYADVHIASGDLALEKSDYQLAAEAYEQAIKLDPNSADAHVGLARAFAPSDDEKVQEEVTAALTQNPRHVGALLLVVDNHVDAERYAEAEKVLAEIEAVNPRHPRALAYRAVLAHLNNKLDEEKRLRDKALEFWKQNPDVDHLIGKKLSQKYRFREGEAYQRQALAFDGKFLAAKSQLAQDLLRLGQEEEGLRLAQEVSETDEYNVHAHNLVVLQESLAEFRTIESDGFQLRMDAREADLYGERVLALLKRAKHDLCAKYEVELPGPIIVEMFPRQEDFAIRTFGMPGGAGFLAVCFGTVITANSPASQGRTPACWEATLWHEFCHVVTLNKTRNKMPRWLSEGISVYEERQADPRWGQAMTPQYRQMILGDDFVPVSKLSGAFLGPKSGLHLQFAYFESSLVVQYLVENHGLATVKKVLDDLAVGMPINEALGRHTGSIEELDAKFAEYARVAAHAMAPLADWAPPELPAKADLRIIDDYLSRHPHNYAALARKADQLIEAKRWEEARAVAETMLSLFPHDEGATSPQARLARIGRGRGDAAEEKAALLALTELTDDQVDVLDRLTELAVSEKDWGTVREQGLRWLAVNPLNPQPYRRLAVAAIELKDYPLAVESRSALLRLDPFDRAEAHYQLARAHQLAGSPTDAKRHVLLALEETPRYRAAQRLLLEIVSDTPSPSSPAPKPSDAASPTTEEPLVPPPPPLPAVTEKRRVAF